MNPIRCFSALALVCAPALLHADSFPIIIHGKVVMQDGSEPGKSVGIERYCSDGQGSAPGPITNKKGEFTWTLDVDPFKPRRCYIQATSKDFMSTQVEISALNGVEKTVNLPDIMLMEKVSNPTTIMSGGFPIPGKAKNSWNDAMKAMDAGNAEVASKFLQQAVIDAPKFAQAWHALGVTQDAQADFKNGRTSYEHAIEADPKMFAAYVTLSHDCLRLKDYACAQQTAENLLKLDNKKTYSQIYVYLAGAKLGMNDLAGAEAAAKEAVRPDLKGKSYRAEYVLARIYAEKGDMAAAKEHLATYVKMESTASDIQQVKAWGEAMGKPGAANMAPGI